MVKTTYFDEDGNEVAMPASNGGRSGYGDDGMSGMPGGMSSGGSDTRNSMPVSTHSGASEQPSVDYEEFDGSADLPNGIEEDQYQGE